MRMTDSEKMLLIALAKMVGQYLGQRGDTVDSGAMQAGEHAINALAAFGLMDSTCDGLFGTWTPEGKTFLQEFVEWRI
jgi:hypothetical protein